jgi:hypothetical protein
MGFGLMNRFIDNLQVVTTNNYNTIAISTIYISLEHILLCSQSVTRRFLATAPTTAIPLHAGLGPLLTDSRTELPGSELLYDWRFTTNQFVFATNPSRPTTSNFIFQLNICGYSPYVTSSLMRGCVYCLQLLLVLVSAVILRSESRGARDYIFTVSDLKLL